MASRPKPPYLQRVEENDPALLETFDKVNAFVRTEGALPVKVKLLMSLLGDAILGRPEGVKALANAARAAGATEEEINETVRVAFHMAGVPGLVCASNAYKQD